MAVGRLPSAPSKKLAAIIIYSTLFPFPRASFPSLSLFLAVLAPMAVPLRSLRWWCMLPTVVVVVVVVAMVMVVASNPILGRAPRFTTMEAIET